MMLSRLTSVTSLLSFWFRWYSSSAIINQEILWITGGAFHQTSTELVDPTLPFALPGPELPLPFDGHCMTKINDSTIVLTGGIGNEGAMLMVDTTKDFEMTFGPKMKTHRWLHGCAIIEVQNEIHVIVAGGYDENGVTRSTELWNSKTSEWIQGRKFI